MRRVNIYIILMDLGLYKLFFLCLNIKCKRRAKIFMYRFNFYFDNKIIKPSYPIPDRLRAEVLIRDNFTCADCGFSVPPKWPKWRTRKLAIHHIDCKGQRENPDNSMDNLITLCLKCHPKRHHFNKKPNIDLV